MHFTHTFTTKHLVLYYEPKTILNFNNFFKYFHTSESQLSTTSYMTLKNSQKSYRKTSAMACLKDMVGSSPAKNTAFFQKVIVSFICFDWKQYGKKKGGGEKHFSDIITESTQIQLDFKHYLTCIAMCNKPHILIAFFKKFNSFYTLMVVY